MGSRKSKTNSLTIILGLCDNSPILTRWSKQMSNRVLVVVNSGMADIINDADVNTLLIDVDNIRVGDILTTDDIAGFEDLVPQWVKDNHCVVGVQTILKEIENRKLELIALAIDIVMADKGIDDWWHSFNDNIDINIVNSTTAIAYPVIDGETQTSHPITLFKLGAE
jgi:hypothetical protein